jgi:hypothetical protein
LAAVALLSYYARKELNKAMASEPLPEASPLGNANVDEEA